MRLIKHPINLPSLTLYAVLILAIRKDSPEQTV